ncbi:MAG: HAMP domain-containing sensor histidine kinase [Candidatus Peribacteraceae bacterium]|nr:HAMP domain-containing sensor histidine kinase [Candidatus Peribacteraceae bacterium]MDD5074408.1 HAMP domain-containing sensor histidine kinase [Candidatus Peribacteraceae bacterium]
MIFRKISHHIALQFTAFVFLLFLFNGTVFLVVEVENGRRQAGRRLEEQARLIAQQIKSDASQPTQLPRPPSFPMMRDRIRITDAQGKTIREGDIFSSIPFESEGGLRRIEVDDEQLAVFTMSVIDEGQTVGYVQVATSEKFQRRDLPMRIVLYLLISVIISILVYFVGLFFARRSLKPAEEMMERLEQFTQDASHELRTPLAALSSSLDLALRTEKHREGILSAKEDLKKAVVLVDRLLELARLDKFVIETDTIDLSGLIEDSIQRHRPLAAEKKIQIEGAIAQGVSVQGDAALLTQLIGNLISNAIKYSKPAGGMIHVNLSKHALTVQDAGIGIPEKDLPNIFDRFYQAEPSRAKGGIGLGLALAKRIVELHGWTIAVQSEEGKGTTFTVNVAG